MKSDDRIAHERSRFVDDLLGYMTLEEKLGQLNLFHSPDDPALEKAVAAGRIGGVAGASLPSRLQALATERSRLGIPLLLTEPVVGIDMSPWALAASWDEDLACAVGAAAARDAIGNGYNAIQAPACIPGSGSRAPAHIAATEPYLASRLAAAFARGAMAPGQDQRGAILAIPAWNAQPDIASLAWSVGLAQAEGVAAIDCAALDPLTAQRAGFEGLLVAECRRITELVARRFSLTSARSTLETAERIIAEGPVSEIEIDAAVRGVLAAKHALGLFRDPQRMVAPPATSQDYGRDDHRTRGTFVLLRNEAGLLPLSPVSDRVLVVGAANGLGAACADALERAGIGHSMAPGLAQRRAEESWVDPVAGDHFALSVSCDAARRADFVLVALEDRHFTESSAAPGWRRPTPAALAMVRALVLAGARLVAVVATPEPVDLADADQHFAAVLHCWQRAAGFEEALSDVLSGRYSPQGRMPASAGRYPCGHGLGFGESVISGYVLSVDDRGVAAQFRVRNSGSFAARETAQVYASGPGMQERLVAFRHVFLAPGEEVHIALQLGVESLGTTGASGRLELAPGRYEISAGKSSGRLLSGTIEISPALARAMVQRERGFLRLAAG